MSDPANPPSMRDRLRAATLGQQLQQKTQLVEANGEQLEVRKLTIGQQKYIQRAAMTKEGKQDQNRAAVLTVIYSTYVPGTNELVFDEKDEQELFTKTVDDWLERLFDAVAEVNRKPPPPEKGEESEALKNSAQT